MRRTGELTMWVMLAFVAGLAGCDKKPTTPDPNAAMYGTWSGMFRDTVQTAPGPRPRQFALELQLGTGGVGFAIDGAMYATGLSAMRDPEVDFTVADRSVRFGFSGTRSGDTIAGEGGWAGGSTKGVWIVVRPLVLGATTRSR